MFTNQWLLAVAERNYRFSVFALQKQLDEAMDKRYARYKLHFSMRAIFDFHFQTHPFLIEILSLMKDRLRVGAPVSNILLLVKEIQERHKANAKKEASEERWKDHDPTTQPKFIGFIPPETFELDILEYDFTRKVDVKTKKWMSQYIPNAADYLDGNLPRYSLLNEWMDESEERHFFKLFVRYISIQKQLIWLNGKDKFNEFSEEDFNQLISQNPFETDSLPEYKTEVPQLSQEKPEKIKRIKREREDNRTALNLDQTVLLGEYLRKYSVILGQGDLTNTELAHGLNILTQFSENTLRQSLSLTGSSRENLEKLKDVLSKVVTQIEDDLKGYNKSKKN